MNELSTITVLKQQRENQREKREDGIMHMHIDQEN